ncbi:hypothetical protein [Mucilaginibacter lappiensis]|uniref:hypothetical protein n=1 Tax=Mucilaginibacter lappiensis TaxID=354630 RepID=UPI003D20B23B
MALHTANKYKSSYVFLVRLIFIDIIGCIFLPVGWLYFLLGFNALYLLLYKWIYMVIAVDVKPSQITYTEVNAYGKQKKNVLLNITELDVTYKLKSVHKQEEGYVLTLYDETFRTFVLFPNRNGWTEDIIGNLANDLRDEGVRVNSSNDWRIS